MTHHLPSPGTFISHAVPPGSTDSHVHVFGDAAKFPYAAGRTYTPKTATLAELKALHARTGVDRVVIVQPSVYGADNGCTEQAIADWGQSARGIAVVPSAVSSRELARLDRAGFKGVRLNIAVGRNADVEAAWTQIAAMSHALLSTDWHIQLALDPALILALSERLGALPQILVFDHFAYAKGGQDEPGFDAVLALVRAGRAYVKLSAPHRGSADPHGDWKDMGALARSLAAVNPDRLLWGSDWPHPSAQRRSGGTPEDISPFHAVDDMSLLPRLVEWLADSDLLARTLVTNPARLYGF